MKKQIFLLFIVLLFLFCVLYGFQKQQKPPPPEKHEVTVTLKLVQVYVTDKKGNPITDLEISDFVLFDNGKPKTITEFEKHILAVPSFKKRPQTKTEVTPPPERMSRKFFLFFDFAFNNPTGVKKSKEAALHFIDTQIQPTDEVGVLSYSTNEMLTLHEFLTTDHQKARDVVEGFGVRNVTGRARDVEHLYWLRVTGKEALLPSDEIELERSGGMIGLDRQVYSQRVSEFSLKIEELAKALRYIPGHKHIILFSSGVASSILYGVGAPFGRIRSRRGDLLTGKHGDSVIRNRYEDMTKELASSNCLVYALNTEELRSALRKDEEMTGVRSLQRLTKVTGGKYYEHVHDYESNMDDIQRLTGSYYVLGYYIDESWDGKYHEIKVKVKRKGCKVHAQGGYFNPKPFSEYTELEKRIHLIDLALTEMPHFQFPVYFPLMTLHCAIDGESSLVMILKIPGEDIQEISGENVEIVNLIFDKEENIVGFKRGEVNFSKLPEENIYYHSILPLSPGEYKCRIVIRNLETGNGAKGSSLVVIPESSDSGLMLSPPLLLKPEKTAVYLKGTAVKKKEKEGEYISLFDIYPFNSAQYTPLVEELKQGISKLLAVTRCSIIDIQEPDIEFTAHLIQHLTGQKIPLSSSIFYCKKEEGTYIFLIGFQLPKLKPGRYSIEITAEETKSKLKSLTNTALTVK